MPVRRQELATSALNGSVYVLGGYDENGNSTATVEVYNPTTDTWAFLQPLPIAVNHNAAAVAGGLLYSFGVAGGETFVYDSNNNSWSARASSHYAHSFTAAVGVIDDKIYVAGGAGTPNQRELEVYDPVANTWTIKAPMSVARNHTAGGVIDGKFYVVGGRIIESTDALEMYDPLTNTWSTRAPMPTARSGLAAAVVNNELWVFGGENIPDLTLHAEVEVYNPLSNSWRREPPMPLPRHGIWASVIDNKIYIPGGGNAAAMITPTTTNQIFTVGEVPIPTPIPSPTSAADPCYSNFTTAEGCNALSLLTTGAGNTALGWLSLFTDTTGSFNTGLGAGALILNNASSNTAVGAVALLLNTTGSNNTAVGTDALVFNDSGSSNTATGYFALMNNTIGGSNTAVGSEALTANTSGNNNTAIGNLALSSSQNTSDNVCVGTMAGSGITTANDNVIIGHHSGVHTVFGQESDRCYIDNIYGAPVSAATAMAVMVDSDGRLGTVAMEGPAESSPGNISRAMLNFQVKDLEATVAQRQRQIEKLTLEVEAQTPQIQNVNAKVELCKPEAKMIVNKPKGVLSGTVHGELKMKQN
jgi:N-acetylneuraminic acid mutarotase